jgi:hypothetical protein
MKITKTKLKEIIKDEIQKLDEFRRPPQNSSSILPIGIVDLKTGANKILDNVYDVWPKSYVNVFKNLKNKYVGVVSAHKGSGKWTRDKGHGLFHHDQTGKDMGRWEYIDEIPMKNRDKLASKYKKFKMYTYK